jgi:UDP-galactopyranose mutase
MEYSRPCEQGDTPYYPLRLVNDKSLLARYVELAKTEQYTTFVGRLGTYRYVDMHVAIAEALATAEKFLQADDRGDKMPAFVVDPLA